MLIVGKLKMREYKARGALFGRNNKTKMKLRQDVVCSIVIFLACVTFNTIIFFNRTLDEVQEVQKEATGDLLARKESKQIEDAPIKLGSQKFLHLGKAGGGTVKHTFKLWGSTFPECHPSPCTKDTQDSELVFIALRDPVDRFVSGFNWRKLFVCKTHNETRQIVKRGAYKDPNTCQGSDKESYILHEKYMSNVSELAMALCQDDNSKAEEDLSWILHSKFALSDWLPSSQHWQYEGKSKLLPMVIEPGFDFIEQINNQVKFSIVKQHGESALKRYEETYKRKSQKEEKDNHINPVFTHSSVANDRGSTTKITDLAECCLARYLRRDYELIQEISAASSCDSDESGNCQGAMESIYKRREKYLKSPSANNLDFCSKIVD